MLAPSHGGLAPPPTGNPGSAPVNKVFAPMHMSVNMGIPIVRKDMERTGSLVGRFWSLQKFM